MSSMVAPGRRPGRTATAPGSTQVAPESGHEALLRSVAVLAAAATVGFGVAVLYLVTTLEVDEDATASGLATGLFVTGMAGLGIAGAVVVRQQPRAVIGWLMVATGLAGAASRFSLGLALEAHESGTAWAGAAGWLTNWSWVPAQAITLVLILRFPDGGHPARGWRWVERAVLAWLVAAVLATALVPGDLGAEALAPRQNPVGVAVLDEVLTPALAVLFTAAPLLLLVCVLAPASRYRSAVGAERRQLRTVGVALLLLALAAPLALVSDAGAVLEGLAYLVLPLAIAWAVLRHRLWDIDLRRRFDRLHAVREGERARLQRDLHDTVGPLLGSIAMRAEAARNLLDQGATGRVAGVLDAIDADTQSAVVEVRRMIDELGPSALADADLHTALRDVVARYDGARIDVVLEAPAVLPELVPSHELVAYWVVVEAVRNVVRHSGARTCRIGLRVSGDELEVLVVDDGLGLQGQPPGVGRTSMASRVSELGGTLEITEPESGGVAVRALLPGAVR